MTDTIPESLDTEQYAEGAVVQRSPRVAARTIHACGHFHLDPLWLWDKSDGLERFRSTVRSVLDLMDRTGDLTIAASSASLYAYLLHVDPELFARLAARVREGRWEPVGGMWVEPDEHVSGGESYIRQLLLGQEFYARHFGRTARVGWSPDSFGRYGNLPRMLAGSGLEFFIYKRPERGQKALPEVFEWTAADGSSVLTYHIHEYVTWGASLPRLARRVARDLREPLRNGLMLYGAGNHGGGPMQSNLDELHALMSDPTLPPFVFDTPERFFLALREQGTKFPVVQDHMEYFVGGGYATHARLKGAFRQTENLLVGAEIAAATRYAGQETYPAEMLERAWQQLAFNQFHDTAAGTCIPEVYPAVLDELAEARSIARDVTLESLHAFANHIDITFAPGTQPLVVFNPNGHAVRQFVVANVQLAELPPYLGDPTATHMLLDADGREIPMQTVLSMAMPANRVGFVADVPPLGYTVYRLSVRPEDAPPPTPVPETERTLENDRLRLTLDEATGTIASLFHKAHELESFGDLAARPVVVEDTGNAWGPRSYDREQPDTVLRPVDVRRTQHGPLMSAIRVRYVLERDGVPTPSTLEQEFRLYRDLECVDVRVRVDWHERKCALKLAFPVFIKQYAEPTVETPYATTLYPMDGVEVPGLSWADVTGESDFTENHLRFWHGVTVANTAKYSYSFAGRPLKQRTLFLMVARGNAYTFTDDNEAAFEVAYEDAGEQEFEYRIVPHVEGWRDALTYRRALELNRPLVIVTESAHSGSLPPRGSSLTISHDNIVLGALKKAEAGEDLIARFFEAHGEETPGVHIECFGAALDTDFAPMEIKTFRIPRGGKGEAIESDLLER